MPMGGHAPFWPSREPRQASCMREKSDRDASWCTWVSFSPGGNERHPKLLAEQAAPPSLPDAVMYESSSCDASEDVVMIHCSAKGQRTSRSPSERSLCQALQKGCQEQLDTAAQGLPGLFQAATAMNNGATLSGASARIAGHAGCLSVSFLIPLACTLLIGSSG